jgi:hypothetical protein
VASKTVVELFDDLDGGRADETVRFALDGVEYEIDLSRTNAAALRDVLAEFVAHAHRAPVRSHRPRSGTGSGSNPGSGGGGRSVKARAGSDGSMTAEIRRLASEAQQAVQPDEPDEPAAKVASVAQRPESGRDQEPVRTLIVPFQEAGL